tara:strand:+ start:243 stop:617 length:375 start_codon:yes stop_codon:yes gene_type:complete
MRKLTRSKLIKKLDRIFSEYIRKRDSDNNGYAKCISCDKKQHWKEMDAGHFRSRKYMSTRYDEQNVFIQCRYCNRFNQGSIYEYSRALGVELSEKLYLKSQETKKHSIFELEELIEHYKSKIVV